MFGLEGVQTLFNASVKLNGMTKWDMHPKYLNIAKRYRELHHNDKQLLLDRDHQGFSGNVSVHCESLCDNINGAHWFFFFFEDPIHLGVRKHYRPQLSQCKSPGGRRETTCYERQLGNPKAAAWTCLQQYPSSARLDTKHIITSCQRFSPLLKTNAAKNWRDYQSPNRNTSIASYSQQKQLGNNDNSILHPN